MYLIFFKRYPSSYIQYGTINSYNPYQFRAQTNHAVVRRPAATNRGSCPLRPIPITPLKLNLQREYRDRLKGGPRYPGLVISVAAVAYHICLALPAAFTQPGANLLAEPCIVG